jgi:DNA polymerase-3 subunit epsilon
MRNLALERPLVFLDLEATGLNPASDRIVELTVMKIHPQGLEEIKTVRVNPGIPIPPEATRVHGISDEDVKEEPIFRQYARGLADFLDGCDLGGFGIARFDVPLLEAEFRRAEVGFSTQGRRIIDALSIYHRLDPRDLAAAYRKYCGKEMENVHASEADVRAAIEVLECELDTHPELPRDVAALHAFCNPVTRDRIDVDGKFVWLKGEACLNFGKYRGKRLCDIASSTPDYLDWVATRGEFSEEVKQIAFRALKGEFPVPLEAAEAQEDSD